MTARLRPYGAAMKAIGAPKVRAMLNNRAENSHQVFRRRESEMGKFRDSKTPQKLASAHTSIHKHFKHERHLNRQDTYKQHRSSALAEFV